MGLGGRGGGRRVYKSSFSPGGFEEERRLLSGGFLAFVFLRRISRGNSDNTQTHKIEKRIEDPFFFSFFLLSSKLIYITYAMPSLLQFVILSHPFHPPSSLQLLY